MHMIVLLTGLPGVGKTTALDAFIRKYGKDSYWILSKELRNATGERVGFEAVTSDGQRAVFAHKESIRSEHMIGSYHVDLTTIDGVFVENIRREMAHPGKLLILDEIGRMEMLSEKFVRTIDELFEAGIPVVATIRHGDEWAEKYKTHRNATVIEVTEENRATLPKVIAEKLSIS
jgi:nucleoside-triphosphatase